MQILLLATGESKKLHPLSEYLPTPMIPLVNRPVMNYAIEMFARQGFKEFLVIVHYLAGSIESYFGDGIRWGVKLQYILCPQSFGTAGALKRAEFHLSDRFMALPADILLNLDLEQLLKQHLYQERAVTAITCNDGLDSNKTFTGAYIFEPGMLGFIPSRTHFDIEKDLLPVLEEKNQSIGTYQTTGYVNLLRSFQEYNKAQDYLLRGPHSTNTRELVQKNGSLSKDVSFGLHGRQIAEGVWVGRNNQIHPSVRMAPPVYIGENNRIGREVDLGPGTILGSNIIVDDEATIFCSTILDNTYVGRLVRLDQRVVQENLVVDIESETYTHITDSFLLGRTYQSFADSGISRLLDLLFLFIISPLVLFLAAFVGLLLWLAQGTILTPRVVQQTGTKPEHRPEPSTFRIWNFSTQTRMGKPSRTGKWLEDWGLHRLPELINVLKGEMGMVGVHAMTPEQVLNLSEVWQKKVLEYKPGFTGYWYIKTNEESTLDELLVNDAYYVVTRSWKEDIRILLQTPVVWLKWRPK